MLSSLSYQLLPISIKLWIKNGDYFYSSEVISTTFSGISRTLSDFWTTARKINFRYHPKFELYPGSLHNKPAYTPLDYGSLYKLIIKHSFIKLLFFLIIWNTVQFSLEFHFSFVWNFIVKILFKWLYFL